MLRAIVLFPTFSNLYEIDAFRRAFDPLASKIRPHITLVFPFEPVVNPHEFALHVAAVAASIGCFRVNLGSAEINNEYIWLPVVEGRDEIVALHDSLYSGPLSIHLDTTQGYEPHLTVGRVREEDFKRAWKSASDLRGPFDATIDHFVIELIGVDETSSVESVHRLQYKAERTGAVNPHAFGTFGISAAEQPRMPKASGDT